jgi:hypothetical protein
MKPSKPTKEYVSPDDQLRFVVERDGQDVSLGFEGFSWHTHADVLASEFGTSEELAVKRFVGDLLSDHCIVAVLRTGGTIRDVWITADPQSDLRYKSDDEVLESIGIGAAGFHCPPNESSQPTRPAAGGFQRDRRAGPTEPPIRLVRFLS